MTLIERLFLHVEKDEAELIECQLRELSCMLTCIIGGKG